MTVSSKMTLFVTVEKWTVTKLICIFLQIETKLSEVRNGTAPEYLQPLEELDINMKTRLEVGAVLR